MLGVVFEFNFCEKNITWASEQDFFSFTDNLSSFHFVVALEIWLVWTAACGVLETVSYLFIHMGKNILDSIIYLLSDDLRVKVSNKWWRLEIWILGSLGLLIRIACGFISLVESHSLSLEGCKRFLRSVESLEPMMVVTSIVVVIWIEFAVSTLSLEILCTSEKFCKIMILVSILFKICLSVWHALINHSEHNFWNLSRIFDFQKCVRMLFILLAIFTIIKVFANATLVSWTNNRSNSTAIALNIWMSNCRFNLLRLILLNLVRDFINFLILHIFFLFFNNTLYQLFRLLVQRIFNHFFDSFFLFFPNFFLEFLRRFTFFPFIAFFPVFTWFRTISLNLFNNFFNFIICVWITWSLVLFFNKVFTFRFFYSLLRLRLNFIWNLFLLFLNKIFKERFRIGIGIFLFRIIYQVTFLGDSFIWQDFEFQVLILLALGPVVCS